MERSTLGPVSSTSHVHPPLAKRHPPRPPLHTPLSSKLTNSERAKLYRRQHKERTRVLASCVTLLRRDVQQLALRTQLLRALIHCDVGGPARHRIQTHVHRFFAEPHVQVPGFKISSLRLLYTTARGAAQATVVEVAMEVCGAYPAASLEAIYYSFPGNSVLLDTLMHSRVRYPSVVRLFFAPDGECQVQTVDVDWVRGLLACVGHMDDVAKVVGPCKRLGLPTVNSH